MGKEQEATHDFDYDLGVSGPGKSMVLTTANSVYVRVLDEENYKKMRAGEEFKAFQGQIHSSPYRFKFPREAHWYAVVTPSVFFGVSGIDVQVRKDSMLDS